MADPQTPPSSSPSPQTLATSETLSARQFLQIVDRYHPAHPDFRHSDHECAMREIVQRATEPSFPGRRDRALDQIAREWNRLYGAPEPTPEPAPDPEVIFRGDVVRRVSTGRLGVVVAIFGDVVDGAFQAIAYRVRVVDPTEEEWQDEQPDGTTSWPALDVRRRPGRDPFRRYLAMIAAEADPVRVARRLRHRRHARRFGPHLPEAAWDKIFWRLAHGQRRLPMGQNVWFDLGRAHWERAASDCLDHRRQASCFWMSRGTPESTPTPGEGAENSGPNGE